LATLRDDDSLDSLVERADQELRGVKQNGR